MGLLKKEVFVDWLTEARSSIDSLGGTQAAYGLLAQDQLMLMGTR